MTAQAGRGEEDVGRGGQATGELQCGTSVDLGGGSGNGGTRMLIEKGDERAKRGGRKHGVRVQKQNVWSFDGGEAGVAAPAVAQVRAGLDDAGPRVALAHECGRAIGARVVDNDGFEKTFVASPPGFVECGADVGTGVVGDNDGSGGAGPHAGHCNMGKSPL